MWKWFCPLLGTNDVTSKPELLISEFKLCFRYAESDQGFMPLLSISSTQFVWDTHQPELAVPISVSATPILFATELQQ